MNSAGNVRLQICDSPAGSYCNTKGTITGNYSCVGGPTITTTLAYPGEFCISNEDCSSYLCNQNVCVGQLPGGACVSNADCDVGLFCGSAGFCKQQASMYQACSNDYQCQNNLACNRTDFIDGVCVPYFTIPNGQPVGLCVDLLIESVSNLCQSGSCTLLNPGFDSVGICSPAYYSISKNYPRICTNDAMCQGTNGINTTIGSCSCGLDMNGNAYCDAFAGDPPGLTVQLLYQLHVNSTSIFNCHTQRRFDQFCLAQNLNPPQVQKLVNNRALLTDTARYQGNDYCSKAIFNYQYFSLSSANFGCQAYSCASIQGWQSGTCITFTEAVNGFAINPCEPTSQDPYCDFTKAQNNKWRNVTCGPAPSSALKYPGDPCVYGDECLLDSCINDFCKGYNEGQSCTSSEQCNVGLYCASNNFIFTCQPLLQPYQYGCGSDYDCVNYCGCSYNSTGPPGQCIPYYSAAIGTSVPCTNTGVTNLCTTGACYYPGQGFYGTCTQAPASINPIPTQCTVNGQCTGKNSIGQNFRGTCTCGYNSNGTSYCSLFTGDAPGQAYLTTMQKFFAKSGPIGSCQTTRRFSKDCYNLVSGALGINPNIWYSQMLNFTMFPYLINNDDCVKSVYTSGFWTYLPPGPKPSPLPVPTPNVIIVNDYGLLLIATIFAVII